MQSSKFKHSRAPNLIVKTRTCLPQKIEGSAVIENPTNENELLIIGGIGRTDIYIYNIQTQKFRKSPNDDLRAIYKNSQFETIDSIQAIKGMTPNTIIIAGKNVIVDNNNNNNNLNQTTYHIAFYSVYNTKSFTFETIGHSQENVLIEAKYKWDYLSPFVKYKHYLITTVVKNLDTMIIFYDIIDQYNPKMILFGKIEHSKYKVSIPKYYGLVVLPQLFVRNNFVNLLLFGGHTEQDLRLERKQFCQTFKIFQINLDQVKLQLKSNKNKTCIVMQLPKNHIINGSDELSIIEKLSQDQVSQMLNLEQLNNKLGMIKCHYNGCIGINKCCIYNSRHLMIYDAFLPEISGYYYPCNTLINFDSENKQWTIKKDFLPYHGFFNKGCAVAKLKHANIETIWLHTMGGTKLFELSNAHYALKLSKHLDWNIERLIWIAHLKNSGNSNNNNIATLPKDIILFILTFIKMSFVFD